MKPRYILMLLLAFLVIAVTSCSSQPSLMEMEEWDLVWISDSTGWGVVDVYAAMVEEETGITVNVHNYWVGGLQAAEVLYGLRGEPLDPHDRMFDQLAEEIPGAELIVFYANPAGSWRGDNPADWSCTEYSGNYVNNCEMATFDTYVADLEAIYELIFEMRAGQPTIVRAYDAYNPRVSNWQADGSYDDCRACWDNYNAGIHQAAATYNIPVADVFVAWNGADWSQDPEEMGYTKDGEHPSELGARVMAEAVLATGFEPVIP